MLVSWNWLNGLVSIPASLEEVAEKLTLTGCEVEAITRPCERLSGVRVAQVIAPNRILVKFPSSSLSIMGQQSVSAATNLKLRSCTLWASQVPYC